MPLGNILVVEDDGDWCATYERNLTPVVEPGTMVVVADKAAALEAIRRLAFAVAFVDISLDTHDQENVDGLDVLAALARSGDHTSSIMVTGKGQVGITRDALKEYGAYDAVAKEDIRLDAFQAFVEEGTRRRNNDARVNQSRAVDVLRGRREARSWDDAIMRLTGPGGVAPLYDFIEHLVEPFMPLVRMSDDFSLEPVEGEGIAAGRYWSRAIGTGVAVVIGSGAMANQVHESSACLRDYGKVGEVLKQGDKGRIGGFVADLPNASRDEFL